MTKHATPSPQGKANKTSDLGGNEVVVTDAMVDAGLDELNNYNYRFDSGYEFVAKVYRAMERAREMK